MADEDRSSKWLFLVNWGDPRSLAFVALIKCFAKYGDTNLVKQGRAHSSIFQRHRHGCVNKTPFANPGTQFPWHRWHLKKQLFLALADLSRANTKPSREERNSEHKVCGRWPQQQRLAAHVRKESRPATAGSCLPSCCDSCKYTCATPYYLSKSETLLSIYFGTN